MAAIYGYSREAVRVKVKKCEANTSPEWRKFSVDPQITSLEVLYSILAKAFDIKSDFSISYKALDPGGQETYLVVLSDWDLDAAFLRAHNFSIQTNSEPCLNLRVDIKAFSEVTDWEANSPATNKEISPFQQSIGVGQKYVQTMQNKLPGLIMNQMEKTFSLVQRALNLTDDQMPAQPPRPPLSDSEFRNFLDSVGQILLPNELRKVIFAGGIDPSLRRVVWKHILNVYPSEMTGRERMDYMKKKAAEYYKLRDVWRAAVQHGPVIGELAYVTSMVRKDVLRTDRLHPFYAGSDDNQNIASLFNILTTYALNHPSVSYCQGMSDIASPLLVTMGDEAHAYICFCAIMTRLKANFMLDGISMTLKFTHLAEALQFYDPDFYEYLKAQQADDLLFCYRWLLLEMKREFPFEDSLRMLEVLWSSLGYEPPSKELDLFEKEFEPPPLDIPPPKSPSIILRTPRENHYTKVCALRRQSSSVSLLSNSPNQSNFGNMKKLDATKRLNQSLDENISRLPKARNIIKAHQSLDETKMQMLMEHVAAFETKSDEEDAQALEREETEEEEEEETKIHFHPTNPFLDDTQTDLEVTNKIKSNQSPQCDIFTDKYVSNKNTAGDSQHVSPKKESHLSSKLQKNSVKPPSKTIFSYNAGNIISKQLNSKKGGHFKDLKEKIAASKKGILASLDKIENQIDITTNHPSSRNNIISSQQTIDEINRKTRGQKVVKNFNEFLNFASMNKSRISDKLVTNSKVHSTLYNTTIKDTKEVNKQNRPLIKLTKNSFDESDSSTLDTTVVAVNEIQEQQSPPIPPPSPGKPLQLQLTTIVAQTQQSLDGSSPDDSQDYYPMTTSITRELRLDLENLDRQVFGDAGIIERNKLMHDSEIEYEKLGKDPLDLLDVRGEEIISCPAVNDTIVLLRNSEKKNNEPLKRISTCSANTDIFVWENPLHQMSGASSCNFNEMVETSNEDEHAIRSFINGVQDVNQQNVNAMTPDEQQDLEYDGEIVIECQGNELRKSVTPLRLVQAKLSSTRERDDSDSDNTDSWKNSDNLNPFLQSKSSMQDFIANTFNQSVIQLPPTLSPVDLVVNPQLGEEAAEANVVGFTKTSNMLPPPKEFGGGNPFLIFLCLTLLLQHRNIIMKSGMDYNEMAMHFDKMVRKHEVTRVLNQARRMYFDYLKTQNALASSSGSEPAKS